MTKTNVLWICTDQQRFDTLGCYNNDFVDTPNIDELASDGVQFNRCFSQSPVCTPSRVSFLTGRYPRTTSCRQNGQEIPTDETLITKQMSDKGYTCSLSGKLHISACNPGKDDTPKAMERRIDDGYTNFNWSHGPQHPSPANEYQLWLREQGVSYEHSPFNGSDHVNTYAPAEHHQTVWCAERAIDFIEECADEDEPWLFSVNIFDPHHPFDPPREYLERYLDRLEDIPLPNYEGGELDGKPIFQRIDHDGAYGGDLHSYPNMDEDDHRLVRAAYWAMCDLIDDQVGRMLDKLEATSQREDTLVVFMSDHGEMLGDHGIYLKGPYFYEPAVRVPLVVDGPGVRSGIKSNALIELSDIAPTILDAVGVKHPAGMQARSLWPALTGEDSLNHHRDDVYCEYYNAMPWHEEPKRPFGTMVRTDRYKLVNMHRIERGELYDLHENPAETINLWDDPEYTSVKANMLERLSDRMAETVDPLPKRQAPW